ncbi:DUF2850 domain-containing protein [Vibrio zhugei]|uniref:DUF2850 domain-containing protein n=1 Tax=Vibrio zhugei TaxID=2479546 RepID=A0ABV7CAM4_9VIBR|nr:DUF2850 domain-containing protein [Vibrio zhugei]
MKINAIEKLLRHERIFKSMALLLLSLIGLLFGYYGYASYQDYVAPKHVYGKWIEIGVPDYDTDVLVLSERGVYLNDHLISTTFKFDGSVVTIKTGDGISKYELSTMKNIPKLKLIAPSTVNQTLVKEEFAAQFKSPDRNNAPAKLRQNLSGYFERDDD